MSKYNFPNTFSRLPWKTVKIPNKFSVLCLKNTQIFRIDLRPYSKFGQNFSESWSDLQQYLSRVLQKSD